MIDERTQELMSRYMDAQTSEEELAELNERIANDPEAADEFAMMARLHNNILNREPALPAAKIIVFRERRRQALRYATAAAVLLVLVAGLVWQYGMQGVTDGPGPGPEQPAGPEMAVIEPGPATWEQEFTFTRRIGVTQVAAIGHEFVAVGSRAKENGSEGLLFGFNPDGTAKWSKAFNAGQQLRFYRMAADADGVLAVGWQQGESMLHNNALLVRFDADGNVEWTRMLDAADQEVAQWITPTADGGWLICGLRANAQVNGQQPNANVNPELGEGGQASYVACLNSDGSIKWQRSFQIAPDKAMVPAQIRVTATEDGGCLVAGATNKDRDQGRNGWIARLSDAGEVQWEKSYGTAPDTAVVTIQDQGAAGFVSVMATRGIRSQYQLVRHAPDGSVTMQVELTNPDLFALVTVQPNLIELDGGRTLFVTPAIRRGIGRGIILVEFDGNNVVRAGELLGNEWAAPSIDVGPDGSLLVTSTLPDNGHRFSRTTVDALFASAEVIDVAPQVNANLVASEHRSSFVSGALEMMELEVVVEDLK
jgi:hypothetical protein